MKSVALHNLGCKVNSYELDAMQQMLQEKGYIIVPFDEVADVYIVNTCSVTNIADRKSRQMLHKAKKRNPDAIVVATGCYVQAKDKDPNIDDSIDLLIGNNRKKDLIEILEQYIAMKEKEEGEMTPSINIIDINKTNEYEEMKIVKTAEHTRAYIKIQDGCNQFCTYCIIPYTRGRVRSRKIDNIIAEVNALVQSGYQEVVLTGIHISSYGIDLEEEITLIDCIERIHQINGIHRIRLGSFEPRIITEEFVRRLSQLDKVCPHFHLSLQSGCDDTLKRMNRRYDTSEYYEKVLLLREFFEHPAITTDVIVGFPGEDEEEFQQTVQFLEKVRFFEMHIFKYSMREGTRAAEMLDQIPDTVKAKRSNVLLELNKKQSDYFRELVSKTELNVLMEEQKEIDGITYQIGHTKEYVKVALPVLEDLSNQI